MTNRTTTRRRVTAALVATALAAPAAAVTTAVTTASATAVTASSVGATAPAQADLRRVAEERLRTRLEAVTEAGAVGAVGYSRGARGRAWSGAAGVRTIDGAQPARAGDTARVASVTKAMVATLAMQEVDRGRWTLDTSVGDVLPGLLPGHDEVTLEQLLSHRSGLPDHIQAILAGAGDTKEFLAAINRDRTDRQLVAAALTQPWLFEPGTDFSYSNTNYVVVGLMLQRAAKRSIRALLEQRVFSPARMTSARFPTTGPAFAGPRHITDYAIVERPYNLDEHSSTIFSPAGAVVASARDISSFYRALFAGRLVSRASLTRMLEPRTPEAGYGLGIYLAGDPCPGPDGEPQLLYGHDGAAFGTVTFVFSSADGTRQASVAFGGRQYVDQPPTVTAANDFLVDAFTSTCPRSVPETARERSTRDLGTLSRNLDQAASEALGVG